MPKRKDINSVLVIGSGPIVIGQACEFDYSGTQACRVLREEGIRVILVNSNPATIMTDPDFADATYVEPITPEVIESIIAKEKPDAILPTLGGQTALNAAMSLHELGILDKYNVELIGAKVDAIKKGEDRQIFKQLVLDAGATKALLEEGKSLLPIGVKEVKGEFETGDVVACIDPRGKECARGLVNYSASDTRRIMGQPSAKIADILGSISETELMHRDNLIILD